MASLKGELPKVEDQSKQSSPIPDTVPDTVQDEHKAEPSQNATTPVPHQARKVSESPLPLNQSSILHLASQKVVDSKKEYILARIYCATNVSNASTGQPQPYVLGKYGHQSAVTKATMTTTNTPFWNEVLVIEENLQSQEDEVLNLSIIDGNSKELLDEYLIPMVHFSPMRSYHLELVQPSEVSSSETRFYVTLIKKPADLPQQLFQHNNYGLEIQLNGFDSDPSHPVFSVVRLLPDCQNYLDSTLKSKPRQAYFSFTTLQFPSPHPSSLASIIPQHNIPPQISSSIKEEGKMSENEIPQVTFYSETEEISSDSTGVIIEFYSVAETLKETCFDVSQPFAYCFLDVNQDLLKLSQSDTVTKTLPIQGAESELSFGPYPPQQIKITAKLFSKQDTQPSPIVSSSPSQQPQRDDGNDQEARPLSSANRSHSRERSPAGNRNFFPSSAKQERPVQSPARSDRLSPLPITPYVRSSIQDPTKKEVDELKEQLNALKDELNDVKDENKKLRRKLANNHDGSGLIDEDYVGDVPHDELVQEYVALQQKYMVEGIQCREFQAKVQDLQNTLIKKNDNEKHYILMEKSYQLQQKELQKLQDKVRIVQKWKDTCRNQEKVIRKMELMINADEPSQSGSNEIQVLRIENRKLLIALEKEKEKNNSDSKFNQERLELYQKLDRAEARNKTLEAQMIEDARRWAKEKSDFQIRLSEKNAAAYAKNTGPTERNRKNGKKAVSPAPRSRINPKLDPYEL
ncbi:uncharacterized protein TRIADDRAFT_61465 [Trichoplax adhaerens]|uniref:C2 domain-containing protein n=1 Tax=Trichoplax adhaerens TaxID=10228 RepID=B3SB23_TRIAD|nr:predicted protein [Trichoplax adhaerens]EDV20034.1 predicted protein [Trichoplax adhaerens]|eukprot:XP_002117418.1 predicted protein [Trichoplax adhaerens]